MLRGRRPPPQMPTRIQLGPQRRRQRPQPSDGGPVSHRGMMARWTWLRGRPQSKGAAFAQGYEQTGLLPAASERGAMAGGGGVPPLARW